MTEKKWAAYEIVDGQTVPAQPEAPVSDALQAAADAPQPPDPEEVIAAAPAAPAPVVCGITRLEQARALPELIVGDQSTPVPGGIEAFKDTDGRTMLVVVRGGCLFKQPFIRQEN